MDDLISRQAAINAIDECYCGGEDSCGEPWIYQENAVEAIQMIEPIPPAQPMRGKWERDGHHIKCDQCGEWMCDRDREGWDIPKNYCPNCGADMRQKGEDSESN